MNNIFSKFRAHSNRSLDEKKSEPTDTIQEENCLVDEQDTLTGDISGMLAISDELLKTPTDPSKDFSYKVPCEGSFSTISNVTFEVISAEVVKEGRSGHVIYSILINPHKETLRTAQTIVRRRYSDFEILHQQLKKKFPSIMANVSFPRKVLTGNFTSETIAKRSTAFEQYLAHLFSYFEIRYCSDFMFFFVQDDFANGVHNFMEKDYVKATSYFEKTLPILERICGDSHPHVFNCLCGLVISYLNMEKYAVAEACAEVALKCSGAVDDETMASLMLTTIRLCWTLGKDKQELEKKLQALRAKGVDVNGVKDLHDILQNTFQLGMCKK
ncbi:sorting nexin-21-like [Physella acuta]|uniref:sorting nexin-21-like n=1 Tax=Physella acuta TaxID=109671 RepID=UPI0027DD6E8B|nr:sorting nexin-21-like [Physella acuta]